MSKHIVHKHDRYAVIKPNAVGIKYICVYYNSDEVVGAYEIRDGVIPEVAGFTPTELQVLYDNFKIAKGR